MYIKSEIKEIKIKKTKSFDHLKIIQKKRLKIQKSF